MDRERRLESLLEHVRFEKLTSLLPYCLKSADSTQDFLSAEIKSEREGDFVITEIQLQGRGREGRKWHSDLGGLYLSIMLRPELPPIVDRLSLMCANAVLETLVKDYGLTGCKIKEPNDVICNGKKISGILVDATIKSKATIACIGMGVNVNNGSEWSHEMATIATSYRRETGKSLDMDRFVVALLKRVDIEYAALSSLLPRTG